MVIRNNGSKFLGQDPDPIEKLFEMLAHHPLDPTFEDFGNFAEPFQGDRICVWGNFAKYSHCFHVEGTQEELADLIAAIRLNQQREDYQQIKSGLKARHTRR